MVSVIPKTTKESVGSPAKEALHLLISLNSIISSSLLSVVAGSSKCLLKMKVITALAVKTLLCVFSANLS